MNKTATYDTFAGPDGWGRYMYVFGPEDRHERIWVKKAFTKAESDAAWAEASKLFPGLDWYERPLDPREAN